MQFSSVKFPSFVRAWIDYRWTRFTVCLFLGVRWDRHEYGYEFPRFSVRTTTVTLGYFRWPHRNSEMFVIYLSFSFFLTSLNEKPQREEEVSWYCLESEKLKKKKKNSIPFLILGEVRSERRCTKWRTSVESFLAPPGEPRVHVESGKFGSVSMLLRILSFFFFSSWNSKLLFSSFFYLAFLFNRKLFQRN